MTFRSATSYWFTQDGTYLEKKKKGFKQSKEFAWSNKNMMLLYILLQSVMGQSLLMKVYENVPPFTIKHSDITKGSLLMYKDAH